MKRRLVSDLCHQVHIEGISFCFGLTHPSAYLFLVGVQYYLLILVDRLIDNRQHRFGESGEVLEPA